MTGPRQPIPHVHKVYAQTCADTTREATDLYNDRTVPRLTLQGWPCRGVYMGTFQPGGQT